MNETTEKSDYWIISNFPSTLVMHSDSVADFRVPIIFDHKSSDGEIIEKSPAYEVLADSVRSCEEAVIAIKKRAAEMLLRDFPDAHICP